MIPLSARRYFQPRNALQQGYPVVGRYSKVSSHRETRVPSLKYHRNGAPRAACIIYSHRSLSAANIHHIGEESPLLPTVNRYYFSVQNLTSSPLSIIFVVRTAHIFPHIEQVCRSVGGVLSKYAFAFSESMAISNILSQSTA